VTLVEQEHDRLDPGSRPESMGAALQAGPECSGHARVSVAIHVHRHDHGIDDADSRVHDCVGADQTRRAQELDIEQGDRLDSGSNRGAQRFSSCTRAGRRDWRGDSPRAPEADAVIVAERLGRVPDCVGAARLVVCRRRTSSKVTVLIPATIEAAAILVVYRSGPP
jgi:hypothetical protein